MANKPRPYSRPSIAIEAHGKEWQHITANQLQEGDLVPDYGVVGTIYFDAHEYDTDILVVFPGDRRVGFSKHDELRIFGVVR